MCTLTVRDCPTVGEKFMKMFVIVVFYSIDTCKGYEAIPSCHYKGQEKSSGLCITFCSLKYNQLKINTALLT